MPFERGQPPVPRAANSPISLPPAKLIVRPPGSAAPSGPGDMGVRESLSRTSLSLKAIREELQDFETEISWRDERLAGLEKELQGARAALEQERARSRQS